MKRDMGNLRAAMRQSVEVEQPNHPATREPDIIRDGFRIWRDTNKKRNHEFDGHYPYADFYKEIFPDRIAPNTRAIEFGRADEKGNWREARLRDVDYPRGQVHDHWLLELEKKRLGIKVPKEKELRP